jgi:hypothetical protein
LPSNIARDVVAVVALLAHGDDAVATPGRRAVRVAAVAVDGVAIVAELRRLDRPVSTDRYLCPYRAREPEHEHSRQHR